jgi:hypothetical protein
MRLMPKQTIIALYFLSLCNQIHILSRYAFTNFQSVASANNYLYRWIHPETDVNAWLSFICPPLMVLLIVLFPLLERQWARVTWVTLFYLIEGFRFTYVLGHSSHALIWICLIMALLPGRLSSYKDDDEVLQGFVRLSQLQIFIIYGLAGIWKAIGFIESFLDDNIASGFDYIQYAMSSEFVYSNRVYPSAEWVSEIPILCFLLSGLVILSQLGSLIICFLPKFYYIWGIVLAVFHVGTLFTVNVFFYWSIPPIILLLCMSPMSTAGFRPISNLLVRAKTEDMPL